MNSINGFVHYLMLSEARFIILQRSNMFIVSLSNSTDTVPPTTTNCPQAVTITTETHPVQVSWESPEISADTGDACTSNASCFHYRTFLVQRAAHGEAGSTACHQFKVIIRSKCSFRRRLNKFESGYCHLFHSSVSSTTLSLCLFPCTV